MNHHDSPINDEDDGADSYAECPVCGRRILDFYENTCPHLFTAWDRCSESEDEDTGIEFYPPPPPEFFDAYLPYWDALLELAHRLAPSLGLENAEEGGFVGAELPLEIKKAQALSAPALSGFVESLVEAEDAYLGALEFMRNSIGGYFESCPSIAETTDDDVGGCGTSTVGLTSGRLPVPTR